MNLRTIQVYLTEGFGVIDRRTGAGVAASLRTFLLGSVAQGAPFVLVAAALEQQDVGAGWLAAVAAVRLAPYLLCSPVAGALAGRFEARTVFAVAGLVRAAIIVAISIALGVDSPAVVSVLLLLALVAVGTPTFPALMRSVHHAVPDVRLDRASALAAGLESAAFCGGPALGGLLLLTNSEGALLVCAAVMGLSAVSARSLGTPGVTTRPISRRSSRPMRNAVHCLFRSEIRPAVVAVLGVNVLAGLDAALLVRLPAGLDLGGERAFGLLSVVHGVGAVGAFVVLVGSTKHARRPLIPLVTAGAAIGILAATSELPVAVAACAVVGASILASEVLVTSALSRSLQGSLVAPAFGVLDALMVAAMIAGAVVAPLLTASFGLRPALAIAGIGTPVLAVCSLRARVGRQAFVIEPPPDRLRSPSSCDPEPGHQTMPSPPIGEVAYVRLTAGRGDRDPRR